MDLKVHAWSSAGLAKNIQGVSAIDFCERVVFVKRFSEISLSGQASVHTFGVLHPWAEIEKSKKLMVKRCFGQGDIQNCERGVQFRIN